MYLLLLGTTALSLVILFFYFTQIGSLSLSLSLSQNILNVKNDVVQVTTPLLFKLTPAIMNLGVLMHWFPPEGTTHNEVSIFSSL
jgi:hypothetical protein